MVPPDPGAEIERLKAENHKLTQLVTAKGLAGGQRLGMCGYLNKYSERPGAWLKGLLNKEWNLRFFCLYGTTLQYYKTEQDMLGHPRGHIDLQRAHVETEGRKRGHYWTFTVVQNGERNETISLVRCSSEVKSSVEQWLTAFKAVGCDVIEAPERTEPPPVADIRYKTHGVHRSESSQSLASSDTGPVGDRGTPPPSMRHRHQAQPQDSRPSQQSGYTSQSEMSDAGTGSSRQGQSGQARDNRPRERRGASSLVHRCCKASPLSGERIVNNYSGLKNLVMLLFACTTVRLIIENFVKYGIKVNPKNWLLAVVTPEAAPIMATYWILVVLSIGLLWQVTKFGETLREREAQAGRPSSKKMISPAQAKRLADRQRAANECLVVTLSIGLFVIEFGVPVYGVWSNGDVPPIPGFILVIVSSIVLLKMISYVHCNWDLRQARRNNEIRAGERDSNDPITDLMGHAVKYPENLGLNNLLYFLAAPTLSYQVAYPRSARFRVRWVAKRIVELCAVSAFGLVITEQYVSPTIVNSYGAFNQLNWLGMVERIFKLSVPVLWGWLVIFYTLFHLLLNITAELTGFGDREFYLAWWNSQTIGEYWTLWNMPVHHWMVRHVYVPIRSVTGSRNIGLFASFLLSAIFHEILIAVPLHRIKGYAFFGMLGQIPLVIITEWLKQKVKVPVLGNCIFWFSFCIVGQPLCICMYYHDYVQFHKPQG